MTPRIVIAGVSSGVGKTLAACAVGYALRRRGYTVQPFKVGPDYIDPQYLALACSREARNLDSWLMGNARLVESFAEASTSDVSLVEGVMGYYDGVSGSTNRASTYEAAQLLGAPVILVVDASRSARSIAATVSGFRTYQGRSRIAGVILNRIGSKRHHEFCTAALSQMRIKVVGSIPRDPVHELASRHLGLVIPGENAAQRARAMCAIKSAADHLDIDAIYDMARATGPLRRKRARKKKQPRTTIGVALDASFNFYYRDNLDALERAGARIKFFSPVRDKRLPKCDGLYIGGGFPEVRGHLLEKNSSMRHAIKKHATDERRAIYAECGGLMYLTRHIESGSRRHRMAGVIDASTRMKKSMVLNYTLGRITRACMISAAPRNVRAHEFHYSRLTDVSGDTSFAYSLERGVGIADGRDGIIQDNVLASYAHMYMNADAAQSIVHAVRLAARR